MKRSDKLFPYVLMTPSLVIIFLVLILPLFFAVYCSVFNAKAMSFDKFVGLDNFHQSTDQRYLSAVPV